MKEKESVYYVDQHSIGVDQGPLKGLHGGALDVIRGIPNVMADRLWGPAQFESNGVVVPASKCKGHCCGDTIAMGDH